MRTTTLKLLAFILLLIPFTAKAQSHKYSLKVDKDSVISTYDKAMLLGINAGVFYEESWLMNLTFQDYLQQLKPGIIRIPGGTWSNELYWNGNRVRISEESYVPKEVWDSTIQSGGNPIDVAFDTTQYKNGKWEVDYSGYAPGFRIHDLQHHLSDFHGFTDVLFLHKFIRAFGAQTMATVNMGTGTVEMAVEWVKWTKQRAKYARQPFDVKYWEMGNELDGDWELGHFLPDGSKMTGEEYVRRYKQFTTAIKKADPTAKVGGSVASSMWLAFVEDLIKDTAAPVDFISFHTYPSPDTLTDLPEMFNAAAQIGSAVNKIKNWLAMYRPEQQDSIEIAITEWNIKVKEDITTVDIRNALWSAMMLGEMAKAGVDIAIQWDMFSTTPTGGHGLFNPNDPGMHPRSQYWALYLWRRYMGDTMVQTQLEAPAFVRSYATTGNDYTSVMLINGSATEEVTLVLSPSCPKKAIIGTEISFSQQQYHINSETLLPEISSEPVAKGITMKHKTEIFLPPYSIKIIRYPLAGRLK